MRNLACDSRVVYSAPTVQLHSLKHLLKNLSIFIMKKQQKKTQKTAPQSKIAFKPAGDRVLVKPQEAEDEKTASGIIIPDTAQKEKPERGVVVAVGPGKLGDDNEVIPVSVKVGDKVMFSKYGYDELTIDETEYYVIVETNILGTFK